MNNNYVTAETAARLKVAGFPQPEPQAGQAWYIEGVLYLVRPPAGVAPRRDFLASAINGFRDTWVREDRFSGLVFAPGVADLLPALGFDYALLSDGDRQYIVYEVDYGEFSRELARNDNPAEALAAASLSCPKRNN